jgi:cytosine/adenosine deaminase-related metal-dependent hydrolase
MRARSGGEDDHARATSRRCAGAARRSGTRRSRWAAGAHEEQEGLVRAYGDVGEVRGGGATADGGARQGRWWSKPSTVS